MNDIACWPPFEDPSLPPVKEIKWPHKCRLCGRFVKHDQMNRSYVGGEYWTTAYCANCQRRTNVDPI